MKMKASINSYGSNYGRMHSFFKWQQQRTISKVKLEQYTERTLPYNDLVPIGLGPYDYRTIENPKYQKEIDNQNKFESQEKF